MIALFYFRPFLPFRTHRFADSDVFAAKK